jgi:hypothetical protein
MIGKSKVVKLPLLLHGSTALEEPCSPQSGKALSRKYYPIRLKIVNSIIMTTVVTTYTFTNIIP